MGKKTIPHIPFEMKLILEVHEANGHMDLEVLQSGINMVNCL